MFFQSSNSAKKNITEPLLFVLTFFMNLGQSKLVDLSRDITLIACLNLILSFYLIMVIKMLRSCHIILMASSLSLSATLILGWNRYKFYILQDYFCFVIALVLRYAYGPGDMSRIVF